MFSNLSVVMETMIGRIMITWAIIIIEGVYKISKKPNGPLFENNIYKKRPTKTGGNAIIELKNIFKVFLKKKSLTDNNAEIGIPNKIEIINARIDTLRDKKIISYKLLSNEKIRSNDFKIISTFF
tara:strand:+ start:832 stop:1206 length:375 start_codon:yes stop_codon:yes gene_type:complete